MNRKNNTETNFVVGLGVTIGRVYVAGKKEISIDGRWKAKLN